MFDDIDIDEKGHIEFDEFCEFIDVDRTKLTDAVMSIMDDNGDGLLQFDEIVYSLCKFWILALYHLTSPLPLSLSLFLTCVCVSRRHFLHV